MAICHATALYRTIEIPSALQILRDESIIWDELEFTEFLKNDADAILLRIKLPNLLFYEDRESILRLVTNKLFLTS